MSPLDDELRAALHRRASSVAASPDPLAGIERRATRMRRNRVAASVAGTALAVAAVATAVPLLQGAGGSTPVPRDVATTAPSAQPSPTPTAPPAPGAAYRLDVAAPWAYRGESLPQGFLDTVVKELGARHPGGKTAPVVTQLFGREYEPGGFFELVFLATASGQPPRWGVAQSHEGGLQLVVDDEVTDGSYALSSLLDADEVPRLLVVASPEAEAGSLQFRPDDTTPYADMERLAPGVGLVGVQGDPATGSFRVLDRQGGEVHRSVVLDLRVERPSQQPDNVLDWPARGTPDAALEERAVQAYAEAKSADRDDVGHRVLLTADTDGGTAYTVIQAWVDGSRAQVLALVETPGRAPDLVLQPLTDPGLPVVAVLLTGQPGRTTDELVVVPQPRTGQVMYAADGKAEPRPLEPAPGLDGVVLVDRDPGAEDDRLLVLDGNGDVDNPTYDGPVSSLLCGEKGCG